MKLQKDLDFKKILTIIPFIIAQLGNHGKAAKCKLIRVSRAWLALSATKIVI